jgi:hypothetical protein
MPVDDRRLIHICGMYKCGTSWLTHILAAHPEMLAWREFDIIRTVYETRSRRFLSRLAQRFGLPQAAAASRPLRLREKSLIIRDLFCGRGCIPVMDPQRRAVAAELNYADTGAFLDQLLELGEYSLRRDDGPLLAAQRFNNTLSILHSRRGDIEEFIDRVKQETDMSRVPAHYFAYLQEQCEPGAPVVLKAADQVLCLSKLIELSPASRKIVIIRDGRDAAISAMHFGRLMQKQDTPWQPRSVDYSSRLRGWASRAALLARHCERGDVLVLRYEDLKRDFQGVCAALFGELGVSATPAVLENIHEQTDFSAVSGGRQPGESAEDVVRKGIVGEWRSELSDAQAASAWRAAWRELQRFGYTRLGDYETSDICLASR